MINVQEELRKRGFSLLRLDSKTVIVDSRYFSGPIVFCESRNDGDDDGRWITTKNGHHIHLNEEGEPDKGNPHVVETMNGEGAGQSGENGVKSKLPTAEEAGFVPRTKSKYRNIRDEIAARQIALKRMNGEDGLPDCTCDPDTGETVSFKSGYQVAFQTSISEENGEQGVTDSEYDEITERLSKQTGSKPYVGVFEVPETSFRCKTKKEALEIAKEFNQQSVFNWQAFNKYKDVEWTDEIQEKIFVRNPFYDPSRNHVKGR